VAVWALGWRWQRHSPPKGVNLVLVARQSGRLKQEAERIAEGFGVRAIGVAADVAKAEEIDAVASAVEREFGGTDLLINNAGTGSNETIMEASDQKWQFYWDLHVMAAVRLARGLVPFMRRRHLAQCLNLRRSAPLVRTNLQRHQGGAHDVFKNPGQ
jgi:short-subunit dehydrogenase